jgi:hypothetical protein
MTGSCGSVAMSRRYYRYEKRCRSMQIKQLARFKAYVPPSKLLKLLDREHTLLTSRHRRTAQEGIT